MRRVNLYLLAGVTAAALFWLVVEPNAWLTPNLPKDAPVRWAPTLVLGALLGALISGGLGVAEAMLRGGTPAQLRQQALGGFAIGAGGGLVGIALGQVVYGTWSSYSGAVRAWLPLLGFLNEVLSRSVGWAIIGMFVGLSSGMVSASPRRMSLGLRGGLLGGLLGGFFFEVLRILIGFPELSRAAGFIAIGGFTGLGVGLAQELAKQAWVRVLVGRNEGREFPLDKEACTVGRDELSDVPLFGDTSVAKLHARIRSLQGRWFIQDATGQANTRVNGHAIREQALADGDRIQIGGFQIEFHEKVGRQRVFAPVDASPKRVAVPEASGVCPYCGTAKSPLTGACACSPALQSPAAPAPGRQTAPAGLGGLNGHPPPAFQVGIAGPRLVCESGPKAGTAFPLQSAGTTLGREADQQVSTPWDSAVSRRHATIACENGEWRIADAGSSNGTYVNDARVTATALKPGDVVRIGTTRFRLEV
ncbi:MAG TPA: FHA domain-containing protein [Armatimonadota bacterium]|jgi:pSer/pThr/pTyr-binding forkhead associated (FHA) protein